MNKSREKLLNIITHLPSSLLVLSPEFEIIHASESYLQATSANKRGILGQNIFEAFPDNPKDPQANGVKNLKASLKEVLRTLKPHKMPVQKYDIPLPNGTFQEKYWDVINVPVIDENGHIEHIIHNVSDVTDHIKTEAALELAVGAAELGTWEIDLIDNSFIHRNLRHDKLYGYKESQSTWSHATAREKILDEDHAIYDQAFSEASEKGNIDFEVRTRWEDGSIHWIEVKGRVYFTTNGLPLKAAGVNIDVTEQRLTEIALQKSKEAAESAARAKEEFLSTMSHEIRTPLNAVIGISNLLLEDDLNKNQRSNLDSLHFAAGNLLNLVNNVLDYSKIQAGQIEVIDKIFNVTKLVNDIIRTHEPKAIEKGIELVSKFGRNIPKTICSDPFLLTQILHNLVGNALKFTDHGKISVSIELFKEEGDTRWLTFSIKDSGIGIASDKLEYIFERFTQQRSFSDGSYEGTGLGLPITKSLVEILGGNINVKSTQGKGSRFYFLLPTTESSLCTTEDNRVSNGYELTQDLKQKQILLVEDVELNRNIILQYLKKWWNLKPDEAENGKQAVEMVERKAYDLILMDLRMPIMNGYDASKMIRKINGYREIPILAFTADTNQKRHKDTHLFDGTIFKPFEPEDLKYKISNFLVSQKGEEILIQTSEDEKVMEGGSNKSSFDISRYTRMAEGKPKALKNFLGISIKAFEKFKEDFLAIENKKGLSDLLHKNTMNVYYINALNLQEKIENFKKIFEDPKGGEEVPSKKKEILAEFDEILRGLKDAINSIPDSR